MLHLFLWAWLHSVLHSVVVSFGQINANLCYYYYFLKKKYALRFVSRLSLMLTACVQHEEDAGLEKTKQAMAF